MADHEAVATGEYFATTRSPRSQSPLLPAVAGTEDGVAEMDTLALCAKAAFAIILIIAGGAKLADLAGFARVLHLFIATRWPTPAYNYIAAGTAFAEVLLGCT